MTWLRQIAAALIYSNVWIATGAALLTAQAYWVFGADVNFGLLALVFFATLATYNFQRLVRFNKWSYRLNSERLHWIMRSRSTLITLVVCSLIAAGILALVSLQWEHYGLLIPLSLIAMLYAVPFIPSEDKRLALRDLPGLKIFWIAGTWAAVTAVLPLMNHAEPNPEWGVLISERFFFILAITIPFDTRDMDYDDPAHKTIPQLLGIQKAGGLAILCVLIFALMVVINFHLGWYTLNASIALLANAAIVIGVLLFSFRQRREPYYSGILDGLTLLQPIMVFLTLL